MNRKGTRWLWLPTALVGGMLFTAPAFSGNLEPSGPPTEGTMHTLEEIYNVCAGNCPPCPPGECPESTVPKTGQTTSYATGDDGDYQRGVAWPNPRFTDNTDGTVTDNLTGLIWFKDANCFGTRNWATALNDCNTLNSGECGLSDSSSEGDWRLPNLFELESLRDMSQWAPALPSGHPFSGVQFYTYWSSTTSADSTGDAWDVHMAYGSVGYASKTRSNYVWPVRGGS